ncbi:alpha/beta hydrolase-fold protein [Herbaspirillum sp. WKF16]|uniref:alpha/beta hydrolase n=1 Tax=Herbaspirillum sp. WKF16 TaxID=3028312 RepID=UPI0023A95F9F|nr:alpha/beta hydrolase-fold protein [Herbaspirillum sp. WKF16]WDZ94730.1 alpha/beta hydrolase-fold protein [Herbaspirillum sp. WKF16]
MNDISTPRRRLLAAALLCAFAPLPARAQPDLSRKLGPTIADAGSASYRFEGFTLRSADGQRGYRVTVCIPRRAAPAAGYPAIVALDGNAALASIDERQLQALDAGNPPVIVAIGYDTELRFDVQARAYDYTPPIPAGQADEEAGRGRKGGGAELFLDLIEQRILPRVRALASLDHGRLALWGHSYGGLFVLHTLFSRTRLFSAYIAASPSLWWQQGVILAEEKRFAGEAALAAKHAGARVWLMAGDAERRQRRPGHDAAPAADAAQAMQASRAAMPAQALPELAARLRERDGLEVSLRIFPGMAHGPMLPASLEPALRIAAGLAPFPG